MSSLAVRASTVKNSDVLKKSHELKFITLKLPLTEAFADESDDSGIVIL